MLCNVIDGSNIDNDTIQFICDVNDPYIFSLLPHILVFKVHDCTLSCVTMCQHNLMFTSLLKSTQTET